MLRRLRSEMLWGAAAAALVCAVMLAAPAGATLVGDQINIRVELFALGSSALYEHIGVTVDASVELTAADLVSNPGGLIGSLEVDVDGVNEQILLTAVTSVDVFYESIYIDLTDLDWLGSPGSITDVSVFSNTVGTHRSDRLWNIGLNWTADSISIDLTPATTSGLGGLSDGQQLILDFTASHAPVPEPATIGLLGMGLAGLAVRARKRRAVKHA